MKWKGKQFSLESLTMQALAVEADGHSVVDGEFLEGGLSVPVGNQSLAACPGNQLEVLEADGP